MSWVQPSEVTAVVGPLATGYPGDVITQLELKRGLSREEIHFIANFSQKVWVSLCFYGLGDPPNDQHWRFNSQGD